MSRRLPWAQAEENARTRRLLRKLSALEQGGEGGQGIGGELEAGRAKFDAAERHIKATLHTIDSLLGATIQFRHAVDRIPTLTLF